MELNEILEKLNDELKAVMEYEHLLRKDPGNINLQMNHAYHLGCVQFLLSLVEKSK